MGLDLMTRFTGTARHPQWCSHSHTCGLGEHRARPVTLTVPGRGTVVLTRVQDANGRQHAEVRHTVRLDDGDEQARTHLAFLLVELDRYLRRVADRPRQRRLT